MAKGLAKKNKKNFINLLKEEEISNNVIEAFEEVDEKIFLDTMFENKFFLESVPIGYGESTDDFRMLARMINYLDIKENERVLEIGTGSGYSTAILSLLSREVITSEYHTELALTAKERLYSHDFENIRFYAGDATESENSFGTVDKAIVYCACQKRPLTVFQNVRNNGLMVYPMGPEFRHQVIVMKNRPDDKSGQSFQTSFRDQGIFPLIKGEFGYDNLVVPEIFNDFEEDDVKKIVEELPTDNKDIAGSLKNLKKK